MKKFLELFERLVVSQERLAAAEEKQAAAAADVATALTNLGIRFGEYNDKTFHSVR